MSEKKLTKSDLKKSWLTWISFCCCSNNWERMQNIDWALATVPILEKLYDKNDPRFTERLTSHMEFFNTQPTLGCAILGIVSAMEEEKANGKDIPAESISAIKSSMMGPLAGIGDSVMNSLIEIILMSIAMTMAFNGNLFAPVFYLVTWIPISLFISWKLLIRGYNLGIDSISILQGNKLQNLVEIFTEIGLVVIGGLTATFVSFTTSLQISVIEADTTSVQAVLDGIMPGLLPLGLTILCYVLMTKKKVSPMLLIIALFVVGTALSLLGIF